MQKLVTKDVKDATLFTECKSGYFLSNGHVRKSEKILEKSLGRPYPLICTGVNGENLQFRKYQFSASVF